MSERIQALQDGERTVAPWTCPYCALHCDGLGLRVTTSLELLGSECPRARAALAKHGHGRGGVSARVQGKPAGDEAVLAAAAAILDASRQPLFAGLETDVGGARALVRLADRAGAILDHAHGDAQFNAVRVVQDRGAYSTTLAEIRNHADLIVCVASAPGERYPEFFRRCGVGAAGSAFRRRVVFVSGAADATLAAGADVDVDVIAPHGEVHATLAALSALVNGRQLACGAHGDALDEGVALLAQALAKARYAVLVWEPARFGPHGALVGEAISRLVDHLNRTTRAATVALGGDDGAATVHQVATWLTGLPLRTGFHGRGLAHEPQRYATARLLAAGNVDALVWIASITGRPPPDCALPRIVLGSPMLGDALTRAGGPSSRSDVFIAVATPGLESAGHLFRFDGGIALPLVPVMESTLPTVAEVLGRIEAKLAPRAAAPAEAVAR